MALTPDVARWINDALNNTINPGNVRRSGDWNDDHTLYRKPAYTAIEKAIEDSGVIPTESTIKKLVRVAVKPLIDRQDPPPVEQLVGYLKKPNTIPNVKKIPRITAEAIARGIELDAAQAAREEAARIADAGKHGAGGAAGNIIGSTTPKPANVDLEALFTEAVEKDKRACELKEAADTAKTAAYKAYAKDRYGERYEKEGLAVLDSTEKGMIDRHIANNVTNLPDTEATRGYHPQWKEAAKADQALSAGRAEAEAFKRQLAEHFGLDPKNVKFGQSEFKNSEGLENFLNLEKVVDGKWRSLPLNKSHGDLTPQKLVEHKGHAVLKDSPIWAWESMVQASAERAAAMSERLEWVLHRRDALVKGTGALWDSIPPDVLKTIESSDFNKAKLGIASASALEEKIAMLTPLAEGKPKVAELIAALETLADANKLESRLTQEIELHLPSSSNTKAHVDTIYEKVAKALKPIETSAATDAAAKAAVTTADQQAAKTEQAAEGLWAKFAKQHWAAKTAMVAVPVAVVAGGVYWATREKKKDNQEPQKTLGA